MDVIWACGQRSYRGEECHRAIGHDGPHMHFGSNGTAAWGPGVIPTTKR